MKSIILSLLLAGILSKNWIEKAKDELRAKYEEKDMFDELVRDEMYSKTKAYFDFKNIRNIEICKDLVEFVVSNSLEAKIDDIYHELNLKTVKCEFESPFGQKGDYYLNKTDKQITGILRALPIQIVLVTENRKIPVSASAGCYVPGIFEISYYQNKKEVALIRRAVGILNLFDSDRRNEFELLLKFLQVPYC